MDKAESNVTTEDVVKCIANFITLITDNPVVISQVNRVANIVNDHVVVTLLRETPNQYVVEEMSLDGTTSYTTNSNLTVQVDCYSIEKKEVPLNYRDAETTARNIARMVKTNFACDFFKKQKFEISPLFATSTRNMNFINDSGQYEQRHMFEITVNYNPTIIFSQDFFTNIHLDVNVPVDLLPIEVK